MPAETETSTNKALSLSELNAIAAEFAGHHFVRGGDRWVSFPGLQRLQPFVYIIADRCEDVGSRWCEPLRHSYRDGYRHLVRIDGFALTD
jgi:hypothetical protein